MRFYSYLATFFLALSIFPLISNDELEDNDFSDPTSPTRVEDTDLPRPDFQKKHSVLDPYFRDYDKEQAQLNSRIALEQAAAATSTDQDETVDAQSADNVVSGLLVDPYSLDSSANVFGAALGVAVALVAKKSNNTTTADGSLNLGISSPSSAIDNIFNSHVNTYEAQGYVGEYNNNVGIFDNFAQTYGLSNQDKVLARSLLMGQNLPTIAMFDVDLYATQSINPTPIFKADTVFRTLGTNGVDYSTHRSYAFLTHPAQVASVMSGDGFGVLEDTNGNNPVQIYHASAGYFDESPAAVMTHPGWASAVVMNNSWGPIYNYSREHYLQKYGNLDNALKPIYWNMRDDQFYERLLAVKEAREQNGDLSIYDELLLHSDGKTLHIGNALKQFSTHGVIVWANSNTRKASYNDQEQPIFFEKWLPKLYDFEDSVITVSNLNISNRISDEANIPLKMVGTHCYATMDHCLSVDGYSTYVKSPLEGNKIQAEELLAAGNSLGAPQVSAMVYLLARRFPNNTPQQWRDRLLMTASLEDIANYEETIEKTKNFTALAGTTITKQVSWIYGLGIPNLGKALLPIGQLNVVSGVRALEEATALNVKPLSSSAVNLFGSELLSLNALQSKQFLAYDDAGYPFEVDLSQNINAKSFTARSLWSKKPSAPADLGNGLMMQAYNNFENDFSESSGFMFSKNINQYKFFYGFGKTSVQDHLGLSGDYRPFENYQLAFLQDQAEQYAFGFSMPVSDFGKMTFSVLNNAFGKSSAQQSFFISFANQYRGLEYNLFASSQNESNALLGSEFSGAFSIGDDYRTDYIGGSVAYPVFEDWLLSGFMSFGSASEKTPDNSLFQYVSDINTNQWGVSLMQKDGLKTRFGVGIEQPRYISKGAMKLSLSTGIQNGNQLSYDTVNVDLESSYRQTNYFTVVKHKIQDFNVQLKLNYITHQKNVKDSSRFEFSVLLTP